jgi:uncharacterized protein
VRVAVTGASGLIGGALVRELAGRGDEVVALTRDPDAARARLPEGVEITAWRSPKAEPAPAEVLTGCDGVVNLLGEPIDQRWTADARVEIASSRTLGTSNLIAGLRAAEPRPQVLVSQSAIGYYGARGGERVDEGEPPGGGNDFLARLVVDWELEASRAEELGMRVVLTRTGVVLSGDGGALPRMLPPFRLGVGGPVAGGHQYVPWVDIEDVVGALLFCLDDNRASGPVNVTAPEPVSNGELSKALGRVLHRPAVMPVPAFALRLLYGEMSSVVTTGVRAVPRRLEELGYRFRRPDLEDSLRAATGRA